MTNCETIVLCAATAHYSISVTFLAGHGYESNINCPGYNYKMEVVDLETNRRYTELSKNRGIVDKALAIVRQTALNPDSPVQVAHEWKWKETR